MHRVKVRSRDKSKKDQAPVVSVALKSDIVRLEAIIAKIPTPDMTEMEARLREQIGKVVTTAPEKKDPVDYTFEIVRDYEGRMIEVLARTGIKEPEKRRSYLKDRYGQIN